MSNNKPPISTCPLRTILSLFSCALLLSVSGCDKASSSLDAGYKAAAEDLRQRMNTALQDPATQATILQETHDAETAFEKSSRLADERAGKKHPTSAYLSGKVILDHISTAPPGMTKDDGDSYTYFKSSVVLTFKTEGQTDSLDVEMPVAADQTGKWRFPDTPEAIDLTKTQFDKPAQALLEHSKD